MEPLESAGLVITKLLQLLSTIGWPDLIRFGAEVFIIVYALCWVWGRIRGTQAERLLKGVVVLVLIYVVSWLAGFTLITSILQQLIPVAVLASIIVFQPEIRRGLGYLGRGKSLRLDLSLADTQKDRSRQVIEQLMI